MLTSITRFWQHEEYIKSKYKKFHRQGPDTETATLLESIQPVPAIIGLVGSLVITLIFTTSLWWNTPVNFTKVATAYGAVSRSC